MIYQDFVHANVTTLIFKESTLRSASRQAEIVAPVVSTSSIRSICLPHNETAVSVASNRPSAFSHLSKDDL